MSFSLFKNNTQKSSTKKGKEGVVVEGTQEKKGVSDHRTWGAQWRLVRHPWFTEKTLREASHNKYVFKVVHEANKTEIKKLLERGYGVKIISVHIINVPTKPRRRGAHKSEKPGFKKAIVTLAPGSKLEIAAQ